MNDILTFDDMKRLLVIYLLSLLFIPLIAEDHEVYGPQGGLSMKITLPDDFNSEEDTCPMVILMHGIFASKNITPMPTIAKALAKEGIASIRFNFGGHWSSEGKMEKMTVENEIADALAMWEYASSLPYVSKVGMLGHSQGGVVASMTAGRISSLSDTETPPFGLVLIAPASVLKNACNNGEMLGARFDPDNPPPFVKCFGIMKVGKEYISSTRTLDIYGTAEAYKGPVLIIHGSDDELVPMWCSEDFKSIYGEKSELIVVDGENHRISRKTKDVACLVASFFKTVSYEQD